MRLLITWSFNVKTLAAVKFCYEFSYLDKNICILYSSFMTLIADKNSLDVVFIIAFLYEISTYGSF